MRGGGRAAVAAALLLATLALDGCSTAEKGTTAAAERAKPEQVQLPPIENDFGPLRYRHLVENTLQLLAEYWDNQIPDLGGKPKPPKRLVSYWNGRQDVGCRGQRAGYANAQYCAPTRQISWDGRWVYGDLYRKLGSAAVAFLLAHEYSHLVQDQIGIANKFPLTIEAELNADCLAGAWFDKIDRKVERLKRVDFDALAGGVLDVADPRGVPWRNPSAHGTAEERSRALAIGGDQGQRACLRKLGPGFSR